MGGGDYPGTLEYLNRLIGPGTGAYAYLDGYIHGSAGLVKLEASEVDPTLQKATLVYTDPASQTEILALGVPHGPVPALAYRINIGQHSIVFSGDQNGSSDAFLDFAHDTDVLLMHMPVPEGITGVGRKLHAPPSVIGNIAAKTDTARLILSHFMARSLDNLEKSLEEIRSRYSGSVLIAQDLDCIGF